MAQILNIVKYGGTVTFSATSDPAGPTLTYSTTGTTWATKNGNVFTIASNTGANERSFDVTVTATTTANTAYEGTATASSAYTITQAGTGSTPTHTIVFNIAVQDDAFGFELEIIGGDGYTGYVTNSDSISVDNLDVGSNFTFNVENNNDIGIYIEGDWELHDMTSGAYIAPGATQSFGPYVVGNQTVFYIQGWS